MASVRVSTHKQLNLAASPQATYDLLADVPASASHFPDLKALEPGEAGVYTWRFPKVGFKGISL